MEFSNAESIVDHPTTSKFFSPPQPAQPLHINSTKKKRTVTDRQVEFIKSCTQALSQNTEINEYDAIGINVAAKLKKMENKQSIYADLLINKILSKGLLGLLTPNTDIYEPLGTNIRNDEMYFSHINNYDLQRPTLPLNDNILSTQSISSASTYDYSQPSTYISDSSSNSPQE